MLDGRRTHAVTKDEILAEIRRQGKLAGGSLGKRAFFNAVRVSEKGVIGVYWATWNAAVEEAGLVPQTFSVARADDNVMLEALAHFVQRLGRWPTQNDLLLERRRSVSFPSPMVFRRLSKAEPLSRRLVTHCAGRSDL